MKIKYFTIISVILCCILISGCGFQLRSKANFPRELNTVYFTAAKPYSPLSVQLNDLFQSMGVHIVKSKSNARFSILISHDNFAYSRPDIVNATLPTSINFIQSATITIVDNKNNKTIVSRSFSTAQSLTLNANQIYTSNANDLIQHELNREIVSVIYYWLVSKNTKDALNHANIVQTARHAS